MVVDSLFIPPWVCPSAFDPGALQIFSGLCSYVSASGASFPSTLAVCPRSFFHRQPDNILAPEVSRSLIQPTAYNGSKSEPNHLIRVSEGKYLGNLFLWHLAISTFSFWFKIKTHLWQSEFLLVGGLFSGSTYTAWMSQTKLSMRGVYLAVIQRGFSQPLALCYRISN